MFKDKSANQPLTYLLLFFSILAPIAAFANNKYTVGLDFGVSKPANIGHSTTFPLGYSTFSYSANTNDIHAFISGISLAKIFSITSIYNLQAGISIHYISNMNAKGNLEQGVSSPYYQSSYSYTIHSYQYLADAKLSRQFCNFYFPYLYFGLGIASNKAYDYSTDIPEYITVTPEYSNNTSNSFTYSLGLGVDYFLMPELSIGIGYRFINLGKTELGSGIIQNTNAGVRLKQSNLYINTLLAQLNYYL